MFEMNSQACALLQKLGAVFFQPNELVKGVECKLTYAGELIELTLRHIFVDVFHHLGGAGAFPRDDRVEQFALFVNQCAVYTEA